MGKRNNQNFVQLPTAKLKERLKTVLTEIGINFVEVNEAYTSKASFLDGDPIPKYGEKPENWKPSGRRIATKLYRTAKNWLVNADAQAAANILKVASIPGVKLGEITRGVVTRPVRLNLYPPVLV
jgi:transposase